MKPIGNPSSVVRKGAWTAEEDMILKNYVQKFGEGKWHLVPHKAGLSRCRKSCRLRWLNYLTPDIKRGDFEKDEVDLMHRLHKLLGNRWSLIAGRLPGRTANNVKNYWNTHVRSGAKRQKEKHKDDEPSEHPMVRVIKPQPYTFSKTQNMYPPVAPNDRGKLITSPNVGFNNALNISPQFVSPPTVLDDRIDDVDKLFEDYEKQMNNDQVAWSFGGGSDVVEQEDGQNILFNFPIDEVMWSLLD
ncbi:hypothetical protein SSX86_005103 [Deinandra increscens subsp. villosa]|uniref:Uncharacterized protein n=1 Tax=Deinandra increscens subsp. villosa TaxID=3103831 RepID=A0AAP0H866_9ASTR